LVGIDTADEICGFWAEFGDSTTEFENSPVIFRVPLFAPPDQSMRKDAAAKLSCELETLFNPRTCVHKHNTQLPRSLG
jgi:hypothetical protein